MTELLVHLQKSKLKMETLKLVSHLPNFVLYSFYLYTVYYILLLHYYSEIVLKFY